MTWSCGCGLGALSIACSRAAARLNSTYLEGAECWQQKALKKIKYWPCCPLLQAAPQYCNHQVSPKYQSIQILTIQTCAYKNEESIYAAFLNWKKKRETTPLLDVLAPCMRPILGAYMTHDTSDELPHCYLGCHWCLFLQSRKRSRSQSFPTICSPDTSAASLVDNSFGQLPVPCPALAGQVAS